MRFDKPALRDALADIDAIGDVSSHRDCDDVLVVKIPNPDYDADVLAQIERIAEVCWYEIQTLGQGDSTTRIELFPEGIDAYRMNRTF